MKQTKDYEKRIKIEQMNSEIWKKNKKSQRLPKEIVYVWSKSNKREWFDYEQQPRRNKQTKSSLGLDFLEIRNELWKRKANKSTLDAGEWKEK